MFFCFVGKTALFHIKMCARLILVDYLDRIRHIIERQSYVFFCRWANN